MRNAFSDTLVALAKNDPKVLLLTGDHGYALFDAFRKAVPGQYINCGIAEQNMVGVAAGLARAGYKPIVYGLAAFVPVRVLEQIKIDVCYENLPVILIGDGAGFVYSHLGTSHQSTEDIACTRTLPNMQVLSPADRFEIGPALNWAYSSQKPVYLRMGKSDRGDCHSATLPTLNNFTHVAGLLDASTVVLATGSMVRCGIELVQMGLNAAVYSVPIIKPFDGKALVDLCAGAEKIVVLEEHSELGGLGSLVAEELSSRLPKPVLRVGVPDQFSKLCGDYQFLLGCHGLDPETVLTRVNSFVVKA